MMMKTIALTVIAAYLSACAAVTATGRPTRKNMKLLEAGTPRAALMPEFGKPIHTKTVAGQSFDIFAFDKGITDGEKLGRAALHIGADLFTIFLWEIIGWPSEMAASGPNTRVEVAYDADEKIKHVAYLSKSVD